MQVTQTPINPPRMQMGVIFIPEGRSISPPNSAVRLMRSWEKHSPSDKCDGEHTHDWKMRPGLGCLFVCRHCNASGWLSPSLSGRA